MYDIFNALKYTSYQDCRVVILGQDPYHGKLVDSNGNKKNAAIKLNCSLRTVNRLIIKYKMEGKQGFVHKNRGRKPATAFTEISAKRFLGIKEST